MEIRVAINGFGRIGRQVARHILALPLPGIRLVAINTLEDIGECAFLLHHDSNHGLFPHPVTTEKGMLLVAGHQPIRMYSLPNPTDLPWKEQAIDIVIESSGKLINDNKAQGHLQAGAKKLIITAAAPNADLTICYGVNHAAYNPKAHRIISASSCTTNCIAPVIQIINSYFGFRSGLATFLHSYTSGQPLLDTFSKDLRRSRNAATNIIPTTTSAEEQVPLVIPATKDRFRAIAIRIPTPVVHLADLTVTLPRPIARRDLIAAFQEEAQQSMQGIVALSDQPLVSIDFKNNRCSAIIDRMSIMTSGELIKILVWHDNEFSYSGRIIDLITYIGTR